MRKILYILIFLLTLSSVMSCGRSVDKRLVLADTLMWVNPDSSLAILNAIDRDSLTNKEDLAYHALLLTQAQLRCNGDIPSDTLINTAIHYYSDNRNREHYTRSLLYKGAYYESHNKQPIEAMKWYKQAEDNADTTDYRNLAQINFRLGKLYLDSFISTGEDVAKFKKSLVYYQKLGMKKQEFLCLLYIGGKLRVPKDPKVVDYLQQAKEIAVEIGDTSLIVNATQYLCRHFIYDSCYIEAHKIAQECIYQYPNYLTEDIILDEARACALLGKTDSAETFINLVASCNNFDVSHAYRLYALADIALAKGEKSSYIKYKHIADSICDVVQINRDNLRLPQVESKYTEHKIQQTRLKRDLFKSLVVLLFIFLFIAIFFFVFYYYFKKKEWKKLLEEHKNANIKLINKNIEVSNINIECKNAIYSLLMKVDSWVKLNQSLPKEVFASKFEKSLILGKKTKELRIERGDFWQNMQSLADATFGKNLNSLKVQFPKLSKDDLYIIALKYLGFSYITIAVCLGYKDKSYVNKKKDRILKKLGLDMTFDQFLNSLKRQD